MSSGSRVRQENLILDVGVPLGSYYLLHAGFGLSVMASLIVSSAVPATRVVTGLLGARRLNVLAGLMLVMNMAGIGASVASNERLVIVAKTSAVSGVCAIVILLSAALGRPLTSELLRPCMTGGSTVKTAAWDRLSSACPRFRRMEIRLSVIWGTALLAGGYARLIGAFTLPSATTPWLYPTLNIGAVAVALVAGLAAVWPIQKMIRSESEIGDEPGQGGPDVVHAVVPAVHETGRRGWLGGNEEHDEDDDPKRDYPLQHLTAPWRRSCCRSSPPSTEAAREESMSAT